MGDWVVSKEKVYLLLIVVGFVWLCFNL